MLHAEYNTGDHGFFGDEDGDGVLNINETSQKIQTDEEDPENILRGRGTTSTSRQPVTPTTGRSRSRRPEDIRQAGLGPGSPLARSFTHRRITSGDQDVHRLAESEDVLAGLKRVEAILAERSTLTKDLKEVSERQTRIEMLLLSLTREMRA